MTEPHPALEQAREAMADLDLQSPADRVAALEAAAAALDGALADGAG